MTNANEIIDSLGGTGAVARKFKLTDGGACMWRKKGIPKAWLIAIKALEALPQNKAKVILEACLAEYE